MVRVDQYQDIRELLAVGGLSQRKNLGDLGYLTHLRLPGVAAITRWK